MKSFIKEKLRLVLEGRRDTDTSSNNPGGPDGNKGKNIGINGTESDFRHEMAIMANIYNSDKEAFLPRNGEGMYEFRMVNLGKGKFKLFGKHNSVGKKRISGMDNDTNNSRYFYVSANNDSQPEAYIQYKRVKSPDETGVTEHFISNIDMAFVKLMTEMADRVLAFMDESGYDDGKGEEIGNEKMKDYEGRKKDKKDLEMEFGRALNSFEWERYKESGQLPAKVDKKDREVSMGDDSKNIYQQLKDVELKRMGTKDQKEKKQLRQIEKQLKDKLAKLK